MKYSLAILKATGGFIQSLNEPDFFTESGSSPLFPPNLEQFITGKTRSRCKTTKFGAHLPQTLCQLCRLSGAGEL